MELKSGDKLGPYEIASTIGKGGMGQVYRARDTRLGREVAIKVLLEIRGSATSHARFFREARAAGALNHPNIVAIYDIGATEDSPYIVMELVTGESLRARLRQGPFSIGRTLVIASQMADGLECAHQAGFVHRDLKPDNIMLTQNDHVKILDFGLAKETPLPGDDDAETMLTMAGTVVGTPGYMSPEQARGQVVGQESDQFSLGLIVYEMLCGMQPFRRGSMAETMAAVIANEPPALPASVPPRLSAIVLRTLAKNPLLRYPSCHELKAALANALAPIVAGSSTQTITAAMAAPATSAATGRSRLVTVQTAPAIAVLPFTDLSPDQDQAYFCEGIAEDTISALSCVPGLRVVSRGSSFRFRGPDFDLRDIAEKLNVNSVLEGRVRKVGDKLRITAQLVNAENGFSIWSERYDGHIRDVFTIQDEISSAIVASLKLKLAEQKKEEIKRRYTDNLEAYNAYLKGRFAWNKRTPAGLRAAVEHFEQALASDPEYALAWSGVADCCIVPSYYGYADPRQTMPRGKAAALKALDIDPDLAEVHATLGMITGLYEYEWRKAEACFQRALEINPNHAIARMWYACFNLAPMGRLEEAAKEARRARDIDPLNQSVCSVVGMIDYWRRRYDEAIPELSNVLAMDPNFPIAHVYLGLALHDSGRGEEAFEHCRKAIAATDKGAMGMAVLGNFYGAAGEHAKARAVLEDLRQLSARTYVSANLAALVHIGLGDLDSAFEALHHATNMRASDLAWIASEPLYDGLRVDPRFPDILRRIGFADPPALSRSAGQQAN
jgi:serine/threonine-protein kinase